MSLSDPQFSDFNGLNDSLNISSLNIQPLLCEVTPLTSLYSLKVNQCLQLFYYVGGSGFNFMRDVPTSSLHFTVMLWLVCIQTADDECKTVLTMSAGHVTILF